MCWFSGNVSNVTFLRDWIFVAVVIGFLITEVGAMIVVMWNWWIHPLNTILCHLMDWPVPPDMAGIWRI